MLTLAIFQNERVYEGNLNFLKAVYPMPGISKVMIEASPRLLDFGNVNAVAPPIFREDSFDPTTRVRRGRFYIADQPNRRDWPVSRVNHYPFTQPVDGFPLTLEFESYCFFQPTWLRPGARPLVYLGDANYRTAWHVVGVERLFNQETLFTLKAADSLGLLPDLREASIPAERLREVRRAIESVAEAAYLQMPIPIVDACRECVRVVLAVWLPSVGIDDAKGDLADLTRKIPDGREEIRTATRTINRFHSRGKSSEQERQAARGTELRIVSPEDAELSIALIAFLLREIGWAVPA